MNALRSICYSSITTFYKQPKNKKITSGLFILMGAGLSFHSLRHIKATPLFSCSELIIGLSLGTAGIWLNSYKTPSNITYLTNEDVLATPLEFILTNVNNSKLPNNLKPIIAKFREKYETRFKEKNKNWEDNPDLLEDSKERDRVFYKYIKSLKKSDQAWFESAKRHTEISDKDWIEHSKFLASLIKEFEAEVRAL